MVAISAKPVFSIGVLTFSLVLAVLLLSPTFPFYKNPLLLNSPIQLHWFSAALPSKSNGFIRVDCYGGLNQMRRDLCDGVGIARLLNASLVLPKFEVAAYWNESRSSRTSKNRFSQKTS